MTDNEENDISSSINRYQKTYIELSRSASGIARKLAFAEGAIFWILYSGISTSPAKLLLSAFFFSLLLYFVLDTAQYLYSALKHDQLSETLSEVRKQNPKVKLIYEYPDYFAKSSTTMYALKFVFLAISSILLIVMFAIFTTSKANGIQNDVKNIHVDQLIKSTD